LARTALADDRFGPYPRLDSFVDEGLLVDRNGERFVDEGRGDVAVANELARTDDVTGAGLVLGPATWAARRDDAFSNSVKTPTPNPWLMDNNGEIFHHDTIGGLGQELGLDPSHLTRTLEQYHHALEYDDGSKLTSPIPGLDAAGDTIGGLMGGYRGGYTGGLMQAVVTGILAGENAARFKR